MSYLAYYQDLSSQLIRDIQEYIMDELSDSQYYSILATKAPTQRAKEIILEFSQDEKLHAENFMQVYYFMTGQRYCPLYIPTPQVPDYEEALKQRIIAETNDYKKYGIKYLETKCNPYLSDLFFMTRTYEAIHAMRIPILLEEEVED
jgi:rubrerythrin